jgi:BASS family bile acid:Na+ symporter
MIAILTTSIPVIMLTFVVSSMIAMGLSLRLNEILASLRDASLVSMALLANFVLMPAAAIAIAKLLRLDEPLGIGLLLLGVAAGAPFLPKLAILARGNLAFGVGLMVLLMVLTVIYMPLALPLLLEGVSINPLKIVRSLLLSMLLPLAAGLLLNRFPRLASTAKPALNRISSISLALLIVMLLATNIQNVIDLFGTRGILASILFLLAGSAIGWILGGPSADTKRVLALATAQRNIAAALVVAGQDFDDPKVVVMVVVIAVVGLIILMPLARMMSRRHEQTSQTAA